MRGSPGWRTLRERGRKGYTRMILHQPHRLPKRLQRPHGSVEAREALTTGAPRPCITPPALLPGAPLRFGFCCTPGIVIAWGGRGAAVTIEIVGGGSGPEGGEVDDDDAPCRRLAASVRTRARRRARADDRRRMAQQTQGPHTRNRQCAPHALALCRGAAGHQLSPPSLLRWPLRLSPRCTHVRAQSAGHI